MPLPTNRPHRSLRRSPRPATQQPPANNPQPPVQAYDNNAYNQPPAQQSPRRRSADDDLHVPTYDLSNGYPKGIADGVQVIRKVKGKRTVIHGVPYEALTEDIQQELDEHPLDDAGQLRVFIEDRFYGTGHYIELGSEEHANKFMGALKEQGKRLL